MNQRQHKHRLRTDSSRDQLGSGAGMRGTSLLSATGQIFTPDLDSTVVKIQKLFALRLTFLNLPTYIHTCLPTYMSCGSRVMSMLQTDRQTNSNCDNSAHLWVVQDGRWLA